MRGVHSAVDDIRRNVFTEVARLGYEGGDLTRVDALPYTLIQGEVAHHRHDVFLERAIIQERIRLALGMDLQTAEKQMPPLPQHPGGGHRPAVFQGAPGQHHPLCLQRLPPQADPDHRQLPGLPVPPLHERVPQGRHLSGQGQALPHRPGQVHQVRQVLQPVPLPGISKIERPCAAACGMDAIGSDELGRAKIDL